MTDRSIFFKHAPENLLDWALFLLEHHAHRPKTTLLDLYKLSYQGILGPEHLVRKGEISQRLEEEWGRTEAAGEKPVWEPVRPDGALGRFHLAPWKARGGNWQEVLNAVLFTAQVRWGQWEEVRALWIFLLDEALAGRFSVPGEELTVFLRELETQGFPAVHHSSVYRQAYLPSYRVISREAWRSLHCYPPLKED